MKSKKTFKILAGIVAVGLIIGILIVTNAFVGNPISRFMAKRAANKYIEENYKHLDLELEKPVYNFKFNEYIIKVSSKTSRDTHFSIYYSKGKIRDDFEDLVVRKFNTIMRLEREYGKLVGEIVDREFGLKDNNSWVIYDDRIYDNSENYLELDMDFNRNLPFAAGLSLDISLDNISLEAMEEFLVNLHKVLLQEECIFNSYSIMAGKGKDIINIFGVSPEQIESGKLLDLIKEAAKDENEEFQGISVFIK